MVMSSIAVPFIGKILPPKPAGEILLRQRLMDRLHGSIDRKVIVIAAPAGYGKTTLAAAFAADSDLPVCWYTLDSSDTNARQFLEYLIACIQRRFPQVGMRALSILDTAELQNPPYAQSIGILVTEIYTEIPECFLLVFDDVHTIDESTQVKAVLDLFLKQVPENCRVLLLSRSAPRLPSLPRMIAHREADRLDAQDLAFTETEATQLLSLLGVTAPSEVQQLWIRQSDGWVAALIVSCLRAARPVQAAPNAHQHSGEDWFEYIMAEVYNQLSDRTRSFLRRSSILRELTAADCDAILDVKGSGALLRRLSGSLQLLSKLDRDEVYRYHGLFKEFLVNLLRENQYEFLALHKQAGRYFAQRKLWDAALDHLLEAGCVDEAAQLVQQAASGLYAAGQWSRLADWIDRLPPAELEHYPTLMLHRARVAVQLGQPDRAMQLLDQAQRTVESNTPDFRARMHVAKSAAFLIQGLWVRCVEESEAAVALVKESSDSQAKLTLAEAYHYQGGGYSQAGQLNDFVESVTKALALYIELGEPYHIAYAHHQLGVAHRALGNYGDAAAHYAQAKSGWEKLGNHAQAAATQNNLGNLYASQGALDLARDTLVQATNMAREAGTDRILAYALNSLADVSALMGRYRDALQYYQEDLEVARTTSEHRMAINSTESMALVHLAAGDITRAKVLLEEAVGLAGTHSGGEISGHLMTSQAIFHHRLGQDDLAQALLQKAIEVLHAGAFRETLARCYFHLACVLWSQNDPGLNDVLHTLDNLHNRPGTEMTLLFDARFAVPFIRSVAPASTGESVMRRLLAALRQFRPEPIAQDETADKEASLPTVHAYSLGRTRVLIANADAQQVQWATEKTKELFFYLLAHDEGARKEDILATLWPEIGPTQGNTLFWTTAYRLRRALYPESVLREESVYRLNPGGSFWFDAREFEGLLKGEPRGRRQNADQAERMQQAVLLYGGPFLPELYSDWVEAWRRRLEDRFLDAVVLLANIWLDRGVQDKAIELCDRALEIDRYLEDAYRIKLQALATSGRVPEAERTFRRYVQLLRDELNAEPSRLMVELVDSLSVGRTARISSS